MKTLIIFILLYLCYRQVKKYLSVAAAKHNLYKHDKERLDGVLIKDPVCGIYFQQEDGVELDVDGRKMVFCSEKCRDQFVKSGNV